MGILGRRKHTGGSIGAHAVKPPKQRKGSKVPMSSGAVGQQLIFPKKGRPYYK